MFFFFETGVKAGGDRQDLHEAIRIHSMAAGAVVKSEGAPNDLLDRIKNDTKFEAIHSRLDQMLDPTLFVGRSPEQVDEFIAEEIDPVLQSNLELLNVVSIDRVDV